MRKLKKDVVNNVATNFDLLNVDCKEMTNRKITLSEIAEFWHVSLHSGGRRGR